MIYLLFIKDLEIFIRLFADWDIWTDTKHLNFHYGVQYVVRGKLRTNEGGAT